MSREAIQQEPVAKTLRHRNGATTERTKLNQENT